MDDFHSFQQLEDYFFTHPAKKKKSDSLPPLEESRPSSLPRTPRLYSSPENRTDDVGASPPFSPILFPTVNSDGTDPKTSMPAPTRESVISNGNRGKHFPSSSSFIPPVKFFPMDTPVNLTVRGRDNSTPSMELRPVAEIPFPFSSIFKQFPYFNFVQSQVFDDVFYTDKSIAISAPTGSGKTVIFELAIARLLVSVPRESYANDVKVVYMAPIKALCSERYEDWSFKFSPFGLSCCELTGDSEIEDIGHINDAQIILTTPEKWDSMTRRWSSHKLLNSVVKLFCIDEIHVLNDNERGATVEAVVCRMKVNRANTQSTITSHGIRFIAVSATLPNVEDIAAWLSTDNNQTSVWYKMSDDLRPVKLRKVVLGYPCPEAWSDFRFDVSLCYRLQSVIECYSERKPTLVFCSTRKGAMQASTMLVKSFRFPMSLQQKQHLGGIASSCRDTKLREILPYGVAFHHAGLDTQDRRIIEETFTAGRLPVLVATSTLAMGVNLPAHLVIIKSTMQYIAGMCSEYTDTQILQMMGRAGRPQFDTSATAVIMTKASLKPKFEAFVSGTQLIESSLHKHLAEHINVEIVLHTITDISVAMKWIRATFLYIRVMKNPGHYGIPKGLSKEKVEQRLQELCLVALNMLARAGLVLMSDDGFELSPTASGRLMSRYSVTLETMKLFTEISGFEELPDLVKIISSCKEISDVQLRVNEKRTLNALNASKSTQTIRFPLEGKIKTREMKVNCLIQATFGCIPIQEPSLNQESMRIIRVGQRLAKCLAEYLNSKNCFKALLNSVILAKCFRAKLWENSKHVARQLDKIGITLSNALVNAGIVSFSALEETNPRDLELILSRHAPFGNHIHASISRLPKYQVDVVQNKNYSSSSAELTVCVSLQNAQALANQDARHACVLVVGDANGNAIVIQRILGSNLLKSGSWSKSIQITRAEKGDELCVNLINENYVGLDVQYIFTPKYTTLRKVPLDKKFTSQTPIPLQTHTVEEQTTNLETPGRRRCNHRCSSKNVCAHECCKVGVLVQKGSSSQRSFLKSRTATDEDPPIIPSQQTQKPKDSMKLFFQAIADKNKHLPIKNELQRDAKQCKKPGLMPVNLKQFAYDRWSKRTDKVCNPPNTGMEPVASKMRQNILDDWITAGQLSNEGLVDIEDYDDLDFEDEDGANFMESQDQNASEEEVQIKECRSKNNVQVTHKTIVISDDDYDDDDRILMELEENEQEFLKTTSNLQDVSYQQRILERKQHLDTVVPEQKTTWDKDLHEAIATFDSIFDGLL